MMKIKDTEKQDLEMMRAELRERRPLPIGKTEFITWSDRIIDAAALECDPEADPIAHRESQRFALAGMLMAIGPTEAFREDAFFALALRTSAVKQTAHYMAQEIKEARETRLKLAVDNGPKTSGANVGVLENQTV